MDNTKQSKGKLVKCKSSNNNIVSKKGNRNKKSKSNAEFQPKSLKKRGVYVEKRTSKQNHSSPDKSDIQERVKPPPRSKPGTKKFLASVLSILSKTTEGTQCTPISEINHSRKKTNENKVSITSEQNENNEDNNAKRDTERKPKKKYKSRILNESIQIKSQEKVQVLKSKKDIVQTPSSFSKDISLNSVKWSDFLPRLVNDDNERLQGKEQDLERSVAKEVLRGKTLIGLKKDPSTLVLKPERDKLYSFFVDLIETVYNVQTDTLAPEVKSSVSSNVQFEIDEAVADKLHLKNESPLYEDIKPKTSKHAVKPDTIDWEKKKLMDYYESRPNASLQIQEPVRTYGIQKKKIRSESFSFAKKARPIAATRSVLAPGPKKTQRKKQKQNLLNILKEELKTDDFHYEEPQNLFQALREIARNKQRCQKSIHFESPRKGRPDEECMFKRRKVISPSTRSSKNKSYYNPESEVLRSSIIARKYSETNACNRSSIDNESYHSLEVYGYDYEDNPGYESCQAYADSVCSGLTRTNLNRGLTSVTHSWIE